MHGEEFLVDCTWPRAKT